MIGNQNGGVISKIFIIPVGVVAIIAVFLAGYYVGKRQAPQTAESERPPALPEVFSEYFPKKEDLTFYKTLTDKGEKSVSIDLKPKPKAEKNEPAKGEARKNEPATAEPRSAPVPKTAPAVTSAQPAKPQAPKAPAQKPPVQKPPAQIAKKEPAARAASKVRYTIQIGAFEDRSIADEEARGLKKRGYAAFIVPVDMKEKGTWYRVRLGSFSNRQAAEKLAAEIKSRQGSSPFITAE